MARKQVTQYPYKGDILKAGMFGDDLIDIMGNPKASKIVGRDVDGLVVEWSYPDVIFTLAYTTGLALTGQSITGYFVQKIEET